MSQNYEQKQFAGGIRNRINRITLRSSGDSIASYNDRRPNQTEADTTPIAPGSVIRRIVSEPPVSRKSNINTKDNDV